MMNYKLISILTLVILLQIPIFSQKIQFPENFVKNKVSYFADSESLFNYYFSKDGTLQKAITYDNNLPDEKDSSTWTGNKIIYRFLNDGKLITGATISCGNDTDLNSIIGHQEYSYDTNKRLIKKIDQQKNNFQETNFFYSINLDSTIEVNYINDSLKQLTKYLYYYNSENLLTKSIQISNDDSTFTYYYRIKNFLNNIIETNREYRKITYYYYQNHTISRISEFWIDNSLLHNNIYKLKYRNGLLTMKKLNGKFIGYDGNWRNGVTANFRNFYKFYKSKD